MLKNRYYKRTHPFTILTRLKSSVILLLIPVIQQLMFKPEGVFEVISTMGFNAIYAAAVIFYAIYSYRCYMYRMKLSGIQIKNGFFRKKYYTVPLSRIQTINIHKNIIARIFGAIRVSFDTPAGSSRDYDISAYISAKKAAYVLSKTENEKPKIAVYKSGNLNMLLMAAFWSNPASGLLIIAPFVSKLGDILGIEIQQLMNQSFAFDFRWQLVAIGIPPVAAAIANILLFGWAVSMAVQFMRYGRFSAYRQGEYIVITRGIINKNISFTRSDRIAAVTVNQSLLMHFLRLYSSGIFTIGAGKLKGDKSLIIAAEKKNTLYKSLKNIAKISSKELKSVYPQKNTLFSYLCVPIWVTLATILLITAADYFIVINEAFKVLLIFALIPLFWWILFRIFAHKHSHFAMNNRCAIVCGYKIWTLKKYLIEFDKIQYISIKQSVFQKHKNTCDVRVYLYFEKRACHTVKHLPKTEAEKLALYIQSRIK